MNPMVFIVSFLLFFHARAYTEATRVIETSRTGRSIKIGLGAIDGIKVGELAKFLVQVNVDKTTDPKLRHKHKFLAMGESVKVGRSTSYWSIKRLAGQDIFRGKITKGLRLVLMRQERDKRRPFITRQTVVVSGRKSQQELLKVNDAEEAVPQDLIFEEDQYESDGSFSRTRLPKKQDIESTVKKVWLEGEVEYDEEFSDIYGVNILPSVDQIEVANSAKRNIRREVWDSTTEGVVNKFDKLKYGLGSMYRGHVHNEGSIQSTVDGIDYQNSDERKKLDKIAVRTAIERVKKEPYRWSKSFDDRELRQYVVDSGLVSEIERQKKALRNSYDHEVTLRYTTPVQSSSLNKEQDNAGLGYGLAIGYEFAFGIVSEKWNSWSLEGELESSLSFHNMGTANGRFQERSGRLFLNWYFLRKPSAIKTFVPFASWGLERGGATMTHSTLSNEVSYDVVSLMNLRLGVKYRFQSGQRDQEAMDLGYGYHFIIGNDTTSYLLKTDSTDTTNLYSEFSSNHVKFSAGLNLYF